MLFIPQTNKYKKMFRTRLKRRIYKKSIKNLPGNFFLIVQSVVYLSAKQLLSLNQRINKILKKKGKCFFLLYPNKIKTTKKSSRMGKGKGSEKVFYYCTKAGSPFCKIESFNKELVEKSTIELQKRMPCKIRLLK